MVTQESPLVKEVVQQVSCLFSLMEKFLSVTRAMFSVFRRTSLNCIFSSCA